MHPQVGAPAERLVADGARERPRPLVHRANVRVAVRCRGKRPPAFAARPPALQHVAGTSMPEQLRGRARSPKAHRTCWSRSARETMGLKPVLLKLGESACDEPAKLALASWPKRRELRLAFVRRLITDVSIASRKLAGRLAERRLKRARVCQVGGSRPSAAKRASRIQVQHAPALGARAAENRSRRHALV